MSNDNQAYTILSKMNLRDRLREISTLPVESLSEEYKLLLQESIEQNDIAVQFCCLKNIARGDTKSAISFMLRAYSISNKYQYNSSELGQIHIAICRMLEKIYQKINDRRNSAKYANEAWEQEKYLLKDMGYLDPEIEEFYKYHHSNNNSQNNQIEKQENDLQKQQQQSQNLDTPPTTTSPLPSQNEDNNNNISENNKSQKKCKNKNKKNNKKERIPISFNDQMSLEKKVYLLGYAAKRGKRSLVKQYLEDGVDPNLKNPVTGYTPLHYACWNNYYDIVELLLQYGANPLIKNNEGENSLETARITKNKKLIELIENKVKDMDVIDVEESEKVNNSKVPPQIPTEHVEDDYKEEVPVEINSKEEVKQKEKENEEDETKSFNCDVETLNDMEEDINNAIEMYNSLI